MEYVEGTTVRDLIQEQKHLSVVESLRITCQLLDALDFAHRRQIIHRDIKPSNVMKSDSGLIKLMDFGLAKSLTSRGQTSVLAGTPAYMAPEQLYGEPVDIRADLFAVGVSMYEMLSGGLPFEKFDRSRTPPPLRQQGGTVPPRLEEIVFKAIDPDPARRFQTAGSMLALLREMAQAVERAVAEMRDGVGSSAFGG